MDELVVVRRGLRGVRAGFSPLLCRTFCVAWHTVWVGARNGSGRDTDSLDVRAATHVPAVPSTFRARAPRPVTRVRLPAIAVGVLLALVVAVLLAVSFTVDGSGNSGPSGTIGTTGNPPEGKPPEGKP